MSDQTQSLQDDISYMRRMAEQGRSGPILGGAFLAAAGLVYGGAALFDWLMIAGHAPHLVNDAQLWIGASVLYALVWIALYLRLRQGAPAIQGMAQSAFGLAWGASGVGVMVTILAILIAASRLHDPRLLNINAIVAFAFYGAVWLVSGGLARRCWMYATGILSYAVAIAMAFFADTPAMLLVLAAGLFLTLVLPGFRLARQSR